MEADAVAPAAPEGPTAAIAAEAVNAGAVNAGAVWWREEASTDAVAGRLR